MCMYVCMYTYGCADMEASHQEEIEVLKKERERESRWRAGRGVCMCVCMFVCMYVFMCANRGAEERESQDGEREKVFVCVCVCVYVCMYVCELRC